MTNFRIDVISRLQSKYLCNLLSYKSSGITIIEFISSFIQNWVQADAWIQRIINEIIVLFLAEQIETFEANLRAETLEMNRKSLE